MSSSVLCVASSATDGGPHAQRCATRPHVTVRGSVAAAGACACARRRAPGRGVSPPACAKQASRHSSAARHAAPPLMMPPLRRRRQQQAGACEGGAPAAAAPTGLTVGAPLRRGSAGIAAAQTRDGRGMRRPGAPATRGAASVAASGKPAATPRRATQKRKQRPLQRRKQRSGALCACRWSCTTAAGARRPAACQPRRRGTILMYTHGRRCPPACADAISIAATAPYAPICLCGAGVLRCVLRVRMQDSRECCSRRAGAKLDLPPFARCSPCSCCAAGVCIYSEHSTGARQLPRCRLRLPWRSGHWSVRHAGTASMHEQAHSLLTTSKHRFCTYSS